MFDVVKLYIVDPLYMVCPLSAEALTDAPMAFY
jgi:hypothetical protein